MKRNRKKGITYIFVLLILGIGIGYAYLNSTLTINGTTNISSAGWNVYWNNIQLGSNNVTTVTTPATISTGKTEVSFNVNFKEPGDTYEFTVDAVNDGTIDAMISTFSKGVYAANGTTEKTLPDYLEYTVTYSDGIEIADKDLLESGKTETYKVRVHYKEDITSSQLPSTADNYMFKFSITYAQADDSAQSVHHPLNGIFYTINESGLYLNQVFPTDLILYQTASEALNAIAVASGQSLPFYLKQKLENDSVTESYAEFVVTPEMATANPGMTAGTYTLRGGVDESSLADKPIFMQNAKTIYDAFGTNCSTNPYTTTISSFDFRCSVSNFGASSNLYGSIDAYVPNGPDCRVGSEGVSLCDW